MNEKQFDGIIMANNIRAERNRCKMSQETAAKGINVSLTTYKAYETNAKNITALTLYYLSKIFDCNINDFYMLKHSTNVE